MTINPQFVEIAGAFCVFCAGIGILYTLLAGFLVRRFFRSRSGEPSEFPSVSILKPLHGDEIGLDRNLESLCQIDYPGEVELVFGVQDPHDPAIRHVRALQDRFPGMAISLVIDPREYGTNRKISNVVNIARVARHEVLVLSDSDIGIDRDYLRHTVAELARPGVGLVTCLYRGAPLSGLWPTLSAMAIDYNFLPSVIVGLRSGLARPCFGSTIAFRRSVLERVGGFEAFADHLADDNAIGEAVRALGLQVAIAPMLVTHSCAERSLGELLKHELRWSRTILSVAGPSFAGMIATQPLPLALLSGAALGFTPWIAALILAALASRHFLRYQVDRSASSSLGDSGWWLMPLRDLLSFAVFCATFFVEKVSWRGRRFRVRANGMLSA
ncbi:bacteriohopanetetrol glucosamine biosynthesis glycosyltransferase HpnI, partial [Hypericibacter sp.]|uniref:bacteriohopanetetrol glucosamine biosynthesis glycosyltransferase HpnI n=1 Tax=Hypericibacter sp. TaxID=2705401 RepID=UPI003D6D943F